jgi:hypothetical protein
MASGDRKLIAICESMFCTEPAEYVISWPNEDGGGTSRALRCRYHGRRALIGTAKRGRLSLEAGTQEEEK